MGSATNNVTHPGATHCEEIPYLFDVDIPLKCCDIKEIIDGALECLGCLDAIFCLTLPNGAFRSKWHNCLNREFSEEELQVSFNTVRAWTNFAAKGYPGFGWGLGLRKILCILRFTRLTQCKRISQKSTTLL